MKDFVDTVLEAFLAIAQSCTDNTESLKGKTYLILFVESYLIINTSQHSKKLVTRCL